MLAMSSLTNRCGAAAIALTLCGATSTGQQPPVADRDWIAERGRMVAEQLRDRDNRSPRVLDAMRTVPRHRFVPEPQRGAAYGDFPLPIGHDQTISQPYIVAF